jgi:hypothetical protein
LVTILFFGCDVLRELHPRPFAESVVDCIVSVSPPRHFNKLDFGCGAGVMWADRETKRVPLVWRSQEIYPPEL